MPSTFLHALNQATEPSVSQALLLGIALVLLFPISVYSTGYAAKKLNVLDACYTEALWATVFKNVSAVVALALFSDTPVGRCGVSSRHLLAGLPLDNPTGRRDLAHCCCGRGRGRRVPGAGGHPIRRVVG
jgi:hypothetical protein